MVTVLSGDLFASTAQTWVNTVNCVGVMGRGVAKGFKERFPDMFADYVARCNRGEVRLGRPYLYRYDTGPWVLNFPTKDHWRGVSRLDAIEEGLDYLAEHAHAWGIRSLAVPPLGCGNGQLDWSVVGPVLYRRLSALGIRVELYAPHGTPSEQLSLGFLAGNEALLGRSTGRTVSVGAFALVDVLARVQKERYRLTVGRIVFQKMGYFATEAGIPTGLVFGKNSYGPYAPTLKAMVTTLDNNGLLREIDRRSGFEVEIGPAFDDVRQRFAEALAPYERALERVADLFLRMRGQRQPEIAATVHYAATHLLAGKPDRTENDVLQAVLEWKARRTPPLSEADIRASIRQLNLLGWITAAYSDDLTDEDGEE